MGHEEEQETRLRAFAGYTVDAAMMKRAHKSAIFLHCLPAHRGEEVTADVLDGAQSRVWDEAENRVHAQKAVMAVLMGGESLASAKKKKTLPKKPTKKPTAKSAKTPAKNARRR